MFPFNKFPGVDPILGPEMKSTGEVMGIGDTFAEAFAKAPWQRVNVCQPKARPLYRCETWIRQAPSRWQRDLSRPGSSCGHHGHRAKPCGRRHCR